METIFTFIVEVQLQFNFVIDHLYSYNNIGLFGHLTTIQFVIDHVQTNKNALELNLQCISSAQPFEETLNPVASTVPQNSSTNSSHVPFNCPISIKTKPTQVRRFSLNINLNS